MQISNENIGKYPSGNNQMFDPIIHSSSWIYGPSAKQKKVVRIFSSTVSLYVKSDTFSL